MWFMNKIANPFVRLILRSPFHRLMSAALLLITYRGRKTGREFTLPVQYVQDGLNIYILPGMPEQKTWWRNLKGSMPVKVVLRGRILNGQARLLQQDSDGEIILKGFGLYLQHFPGLARLHNVGVDKDGILEVGQLCTASAAVHLILVELGEEGSS